VPEVRTIRVGLKRQPAAKQMFLKVVVFSPTKRGGRRWSIIVPRVAIEKGNSIFPGSKRRRR
jgi:hypothetical protein